MTEETKHCTYCFKTKPRSEFRKTGAKCKQCHKEHRAVNRNKTNAQKREYYQQNKEQYRARQRAYYEHNSEKIIKAQHERTDYTARDQKNFKRWMSRCVRNTRSSDKNCERPNDLTIAYVMQVLEAQDFKCAITGLDLTHEYNSHFAASIDRIDSSIGHVEGNIQIVCAAVNLAKRHHSNESILGFFESFARAFVLRYSFCGVLKCDGSGKPVPYVSSGDGVRGKEMEAPSIIRSPWYEGPTMLGPSNEEFLNEMCGTFVNTESEPNPDCEIPLDVVREFESDRNDDGVCSECDEFIVGAEARAGICRECSNFIETGELS